MPIQKNSPPANKPTQKQPEKSPKKQMTVPTPEILSGETVQIQNAEFAQLINVDKLH